MEKSSRLLGLVLFLACEPRQLFKDKSDWKDFRRFTHTHTKMPYINQSKLLMMLIGNEVEGNCLSRPILYIMQMVKKINIYFSDQTGPIRPDQARIVKICYIDTSHICSIPYELINQDRPVTGTCRHFFRRRKVEKMENKQYLNKHNLQPHMSCNKVNRFPPGNDKQVRSNISFQHQKYDRIGKRESSQLACAWKSPSPCIIIPSSNLSDLIICLAWLAGWLAQVRVSLVDLFE